MCIRDAINIQGQPEPYLKTICLPHLVTFVSERKQSLVSLEGCLSKCHINLHNALVDLCTMSSIVAALQRI